MTQTVLDADAPSYAQLKEFFAQIESGRITKSHLQEFLKDDDKSSILTRLYAHEEIVIGSTTGKEILVDAKNVFTGYLDPDFSNLGTNKPSKATRDATVAIYKTQKGTTFVEMFGSLGELNNLTLTQGQIIEFCRTHSDKLRQNGEATFFLFEVEGKCFVVDVRVYERKNALEAYVDRSDNNHPWSAYSQLWLVVPQL